MRHSGTGRGSKIMGKQGIAMIARLGAFLKNRKGMAAVEFALIVPILLTLYFVTMEIGQGIDANKKVSRVGAMVADLVGQQGHDVSKKELDPILAIGEAIMLPYTRSRPDIVITFIAIDKNAKATVKWSRKLENGNFDRDVVKGTPVSVSKDLLIPETFLLRVSAHLNYKPVIGWAADQKLAQGLLGGLSSISMAESYDQRPRMTSDMNCSDC